MLVSASRATVQEQRRYLLKAIHSFSDLIKAAVNGTYSHSFFGSASTYEGYQKRLRALLQNTLTDFAETMRKNGHKYDIIDEDIAVNPGQISRRDYISKVKTLLKQSRGRNLPGIFDPLIIGELFREQREPRAKLVNAYIDKVVCAVYYVVHVALAHVSDRSTLEGLLRQLIYPGLEGLKLDLQEKVDEILRHHELVHPITYNHYLTENVQKAQGRPHTRETKQSLKQFFGKDYTSC